jgi:predicted DNA-binding protein
MTLTIALPADLEDDLHQEARRLGLSPAQYSAQALMHYLAEVRARREAVELLESWLTGDITEQQTTGEELIRSLEEDRHSARSLFPRELKGVTW